MAGLSVSDFSPTVAGLLGVTPLLLFSYLGFESGNSAAGEMKNPARDVPIAIARSAGIAAAAYLLPIFAILVVLPKDDITGIGGLMEAVAKVFSVYGAAAPAMLTVTGVIFAVILMTQGSAWMIISDRMQAMAAADGAFFGASSADSILNWAPRCGSTCSPVRWRRCSAWSPCRSPDRRRRSSVWC